jgi:hypothetical protein
LVPLDDLQHFGIAKVAVDRVLGRDTRGAEELDCVCRDAPYQVLNLPLVVT